jgi:hypothetical protein
MIKFYIAVAWWLLGAAFVILTVAQVFLAYRRRTIKRRLWLHLGVAVACAAGACLIGTWLDKVEVTW